MDDARKRIAHEMTMCLVTRHLADEQQRRMTHLHLLTSLDRKRGNFLRRDLGHQFRNAASDLDAVLVELALPKQAGQHRAAQLELRRDVPGSRALVSARAEVEGVKSSHSWPP